MLLSLTDLFYFKITLVLCFNHLVQFQLKSAIIHLSFFELSVNFMLNKKSYHSIYLFQAIYEDQAFLSSQSGTALLDKFTHCLLVKNNSDMLDTLLNTLIRQIKLQPEVAKTVAKRFVRSVIRVFVVFNIELPPGQVINP